jgi:hypothetical protein
MDERGRAIAESARVRARLMRTPGARCCPFCAVITQGYGKGLESHVRRIHPERMAGNGG